MYIEHLFLDDKVDNLLICRICDGAGGFDISVDCEVYDDWQECPYCLGTGEDENEPN